MKVSSGIRSDTGKESSLVGMAVDMKEISRKEIKVDTVS